MPAWVSELGNRSGGVNSMNWWPLTADCAEEAEGWVMQPDEGKTNAENLHPHISILHSERFGTLNTAGDGACAIHSVFGKPTVFGLSRKLFVENSRKKARITIGESAEVFQERLRSQVLYDSVVSSLWADLLLPVMAEKLSLQLQIPLHSNASGRILWACICENQELKNRLESHLKSVVEMRACSDKLRINAVEAFTSVCFHTSAVFLWRLIEDISRATEWCPLDCPFNEDSKGRRLVKGTQAEMPAEEPPLTNFQALGNICEACQGWFPSKFPRGRACEAACQ